MTTEVTVTVTETEAKTLSRDEIRSAIFSAKPKSVLVENFFGVTLELRQPGLQQALQVRETDQAEQVYTMLLDYSYVPGTNEKVFSPEDVDSLRELPFGGEMVNLISKVTELLGTDPAVVEAEIKKAEKSA